ncbi:amino acid ABC transporter permease [uncultured Bosea sp.]|uniref:amino acid ABC transporter permease n=1 Tax=uncultured Bosea sp. TaxID=211457 RepID=UPI0025E8E722|nr:amino acid ABC transporter permease [uncultured Bosea sp.]
MSSLAEAVPVAGLPQSRRLVAAGRWLRSNLFSSWWNALLTGLVLYGIVTFVAKALSWGVVEAVPFSGSRAECAAASGACWAFLREKVHLVLTGTYPEPERWRAYLASGVMIAAILAFAKTPIGVAGRAVLVVVSGTCSYLLLRGGVAGLPVVESHRWNGLPLILFLSAFSMAAAFPLGVALALARWSGQRGLSLFAVGYIEAVRAIPMVAVLFAGIFILPLLLSRGAAIEPVAAILIVLTLFYAAYFAEDVRGGLQALPKGQTEAAASLGLSSAQRIRLIVLPQALRTAIPGITNSIIGSFKDTSLVAIVGMHDLLSTARMAYADPQWQAYSLEANLAIGLFYFISCWLISERARRLGHGAVKAH